MIPRKKAGDYELYVKQFMNDLHLGIENANKIINATKMNKQTGYTPTIMEDTRTTREKLQDTIKLKQDVTKGLKEIADGTEITQILSQVTDGELIFLAQHLGEIVAKLKPRYKYGITSMEFLDYLREYIDTYTAAHGVDFGGNTGLLNRIETLINRLPQQADITTMSNILGQQITLMSRHLEDRIAQAAAANDEAQADRFRRIMLEMQIKHDVLSRDIQEYKKILEGFETSLDIIESQTSEVNKAELNEIIDRLKGLPDMKSIEARFDAIQRAIDSQDYSDFIKQIDKLTNDLDRYRDALDVSQTKAYINLYSDWRPRAWSSFNSMTVSEKLEYLQQTYDVIEQNSLTTISDPLISQSSAEIIRILDLAKRVFFSDQTFGEVIDFLRSRGKMTAIGFRDTFLIPYNTSVVENEELSQEEKDELMVGESVAGFAKWLEKQGLRASLKVFSDEMKKRDVAIRADPIEGIVEDPTEGAPYDEKESEPKPVEGSGLRGQHLGVFKPDKVWRRKTYLSRSKTISGRGVKTRKRYDKIQPEDIDYSRGVRPTPKFIPLGKYVVNHHRLLNDNFLSVKTVSGAGVHGLPPTRISHKFSEVIDTMLKNKNPSFDTLNDLSKDEKEYLYKLAKKSNILDRFTIPTPDKSKEDKELHEFEVLRGQIMSGNDNKELIKKFKLMLVKLANGGLIPKNQSNAILTELATLGY